LPDDSHAFLGSPFFPSASQQYSTISHFPAIYVSPTAKLGQTFSSLEFSSSSDKQQVAVLQARAYICKAETAEPRQLICACVRHLQVHYIYTILITDYLPTQGYQSVFCRRSDPGRIRINDLETQLHNLQLLPSKHGSRNQKKKRNGKRLSLLNASRPLTSLFPRLFRKSIRTHRPKTGPRLTADVTSWTLATSDHYNSHPLMSSPRSANRTSPQFTYHLRRKSYSSPLPQTGSSTSSKRSTLQPHSNSSTINPSPLKMVTTSTNPHYSQQGASSHYMVTEGGSQAYGWVESISIEDDDLMFGGKSLSAWHEEGRQKVSYPEEERRGRQRVSVWTQGDSITRLLTI
jgi:hypothetical protein